MPVLLLISSTMSELLGSLVYHLLLLLAVQAALAIAWGEWRRARQAQGQRLFVAMAGITLANVCYLAAALLVRTDLIATVLLVLPLERTISIVSLGFLAWAFVPRATASKGAWNLALAANTALAVVTLAVFAMFWQQALVSATGLDYNTYWQSRFWSVWQIGLILLTIYGVVTNKEEGWGTLLLAMIAMLVGQVMQVAYPQGLVRPHLPVWERLATLIAYPLIVVAVYQRSVAGMRRHSRQLQDISQASLDQIKSLLHLSEASRLMSSSLDLSTVLENAVQGVARALDADQCAIAFPLEEDPGQMCLAAIYNPVRQGRGEKITFPLDYQLAVQQAIRRKKHVILEKSDNVQLRALFGLLGASETGPLLVQPLFSKGQASGAIIVGNARTQRPFTPNEAKLCHSIAVQLGNAIQNARHYQLAKMRIEELSKAQSGDERNRRQSMTQLVELQEQVTNARAEVETLREARNDLESKLLSSRAETDTLKKRLSELEGDMARQQAEWQGTLHAILPGMTAGVLVTDEQDVIRATNMAAEILLERSGSELQGLELKAISDAEEWQQAVAMANDGEAVHLAMQIGSNALVCDVAPLPKPGRDQDGMEGLVVILQGRTPELENQQARLEAIASMAEELRTPMSTVIGYADLLLSEAMGGVAGVQRKFLLRIKADAERVIQIANDLSSQAGGEGPWRHPKQQMVDLHQLIEESVTAARAQLETRNLTVDLELATDLPMVEADPDFLQRILSGLLSNACMASPVGGRIQVITATGDASLFDGLLANGDGRCVTVAIKDQGGGLSNKALSQVFERTRPSQTPPGLGESGSGLALVKTLVEAHGGHLWVESEKGASTTFSFALPADRQNGQVLVDPFVSEQDQPTPVGVAAG